MLIASIDGLPPSPAPAREGVVVSTPRPQAAPAYAAVAELAPAPAPAPAPTPEAVKEAVAKSNEALKAHSQAVEFQYDFDAHEMVVRVVDTNNGQVLRQMPTPEMLEIARDLERMQSVLINAKV